MSTAGFLAGPVGPRVFAHRGTQAAPPNTLPAVAHLLAAGCDGLAVDVAVTRDGVLVAADDALVRAAGLSAAAITDLAWDQLACIDFAAALGHIGAPAMLLAVEDLLAFLSESVLVALRFSSLEARELAALDRCKAPWHRTLLIGPTIESTRALASVAPGAVRVAIAGPSEPQDGIDGVAADVRAFAAAPGARGLRVGLGCSTAVAADLAWRIGLDIALTERPTWLAARFARMAAEQRGTARPAC